MVLRTQGGFSPIINLLAGLVIATGIGVSVYLIQQRTNILPFAQQDIGGTCQPPAEVTNVKVEYPACEGTPLECSFEQASCSWDPTVGAVTYSLTVTEVDTGAVIKSEQVPSTTNRVTFPIVQGRTYKCDVSAINDCGAVGLAGTDQLLCQIEGFTPPAPVVPPPVGAPAPPPPVVVVPPPVVAPPAPTPPPTLVPVPTPAPLACGYAPCNDTNLRCQSGLVCVTAGNGTKICANPSYQDACRANPSGPTCCQAPVVVKQPPPQQLPPAGTAELTSTIGIFSATLVILGVLGLLLL